MTNPYSFGSNQTGNTNTTNNTNYNNTYGYQNTMNHMNQNQMNYSNTKNMQNNQMNYNNPYYNQNQGQNQMNYYNTNNMQNNQMNYNNNQYQYQNQGQNQMNYYNTNNMQSNQMNYNNQYQYQNQGQNNKTQQTKTTNKTTQQQMQQQQKKQQQFQKQQQMQQQQQKQQQFQQQQQVKQKKETQKFGPKTKIDVNLLKQATQTITKPLKLFTNTKEREKVDNFANLYSIIKTVEYLERAYVRDAISSENYTKECGKLISQFKVALDSVGMKIENVSQWMNNYGMNCKAAEKTLIEQGVPSTIIHGNNYEKEQGESGVFIFQTASFFITAMDSVKLNMIAVDQLQPVLSDLLNSLNKIDKLKPDFDGKVRITKWLKTLNTMMASDELSNEQSRQLLFDLETSYNLLNSTLKQK
ncbi:vacuolar protein sorting 28 isoform 2 vps28 [Anaeramoeba flamelloides]|uniref:Vacuolar protein sorting 28 isoform 2 vps28 n=1 Tax=Anaeramoeba flamelloides TaxID=1746091 RepID=A0AAV8AG41_9EUKA|nr:vacuolar protein sorting 28 isoform 2 vps28 [Anaeramoeba flamelloides]